MTEEEKVAHLAAHMTVLQIKEPIRKKLNLFERISMFKEINPISKYRMNIYTGDLEIRRYDYG